MVCTDLSCNSCNGREFRLRALAGLIECEKSRIWLSGILGTNELTSQVMDSVQGGVVRDPLYVMIRPAGRQPSCQKSAQSWRQTSSIRAVLILESTWEADRKGQGIHVLSTKKL